MEFLMEFNLTVSDVARKYGISRTTVINWAKDFEIGVKVGGRWRVSEEKLQKVLDGEIHYPFRYEKSLNK